MKALLFVVLVIVVSALRPDSTPAQSGRAKDAAANTEATSSNAGDANEKRSAAELFEDADKYLKRKFDAFQKAKMPYDQRLDDKIRKEQRDLAARYATVVAKRKPQGQDLYYLGLLYNLAVNPDAATEVMRHYLAENPEATGEPAQNARAIIVLHAAKKNLMPEAESRLAEYVKNQPQVPEDRYTLENWVSTAYFNQEDYDRALAHGLQMWLAAKASLDGKSRSARDERLAEAAGNLSEFYLKLKKKDEALAVVRELNQLSLQFPSGNLHKMALLRMLEIDPQLDLFKNLDNSRDDAALAPEITVNEWIDQRPTKLADLRGHVVLLDFWATWCAPCRATLPRLQKWYENYKDKGLVILGLTTFEGHAEGKPLSRPQELDYLRSFKKKFNLAYGFGVSEESNNDRNYSVASIPTTFLIDRRGVVRFISIGSSDIEASALQKMIKKLIEEAAPNAAEAATK